MLPGESLKRSTVSRFCLRIRNELYDYKEVPTPERNILNDDSILFPYTGKISRMLSESKTIIEIFNEIKTEGYGGSYSLLQQYCAPLKPLRYRIKKNVHKIKRTDVTSEIWSDESDLTPEDLAYIADNFQVYGEIKSIIQEFRQAYKKKDIGAVKSWCDKYQDCQFPPICSFINGINMDTEAFYNSLKYEYNNGLLEGCVNKLKTVKRSMYGRANYFLIRAKMLLGNEYKTAFELS